MSEEKTFSRTYRFSGETIRKLLEVQQQRDFPSITLALETIIAEAHNSSQAQEKPVTLELCFQQFLGDELSERHIDFLEERKKKQETLQDVFRRFIIANGIDITKEEWKERVAEGAKVNPFKIREPEKCHYRVITEEGEWYCDTKKIPPEVCIQRQERYLWRRQKENNPQIICRPKDMKKPSFRKTSKGRGIEIPTTTYCYIKKEKVSIREVCYNPQNPCEKHNYCRSLDYYKQQLEKARLRGQI